MKYIKNFESINVNEIQDGDYVLCAAPDYVVNPLLKKFLNSSIGKVINVVKYSPTSHIKYNIKYENIPQEIDRHFNNDIRIVKNSEIVEYAKTKYDLEVKLDSKKYNL